MSQPPALPLFVREYLMDTRHLTTEQHGAYLLLLMQSWCTPDCSLPDDDKKLAAWTGLPLDRWKEMRPVIIEFFDVLEARLKQKRLQHEFQFVRERVERNQNRARLGGLGKAGRYKKNNKLDAAISSTQAGYKQPQAMLKPAQPTPTPILNSARARASHQEGSRASPAPTANPLVFVVVDTPQWHAWADFRRAKGLSGVPVTESDQEGRPRGWYFQSEWPPDGSKPADDKSSKSSA